MSKTSRDKFYSNHQQQQQQKLSNQLPEQQAHGQLKADSLLYESIQKLGLQTNMTKVSRARSHLRGSHTNSNAPSGIAIFPAATNQAMESQAKVLQSQQRSIKSTYHQHQVKSRKSSVQMTIADAATSNTNKINPFPQQKRIVNSIKIQTLQQQQQQQHDLQNNQDLNSQQTMNVVQNNGNSILAFKQNRRSTEYKMSMGAIRTQRDSDGQVKDNMEVEALNRGTVTTTLQSVTSGLAQLSGDHNSVSQSIKKIFQQSKTAQKGHISGRSSAITQFQNSSSGTGVVQANTARHTAAIFKSTASKSLSKQRISMDLSIREKQLLSNSVVDSPRVINDQLKISTRARIPTMAVIQRHQQQQMQSTSPQRTHFMDSVRNSLYHHKNNHNHQDQNTTRRDSEQERVQYLSGLAPQIGSINNAQTAAQGLSVIGDAKRYGSNLRGLNSEQSGKLSIGSSSMWPNKAKPQTDFANLNDPDQSPTEFVGSMIDDSNKEQRKLNNLPNQQISTQPQMKITLDEDQQPLIVEQEQEQVQDNTKVDNQKHQLQNNGSEITHLSVPGNEQDNTSLSSLIVAKKAIKNLRMQTYSNKNINKQSRPNKQRQIIIANKDDKSKHHHQSALVITREEDEVVNVGSTDITSISIRVKAQAHLPQNIQIMNNSEQNRRQDCEAVDSIGQNQNQQIAVTNTASISPQNKIEYNYLQQQTSQNHDTKALFHQSTRLGASSVNFDSQHHGSKNSMMTGPSKVHQGRQQIEEQMGVSNKFQLVEEEYRPQSQEREQQSFQQYSQIAFSAASNINNTESMIVTKLPRIPEAAFQKQQTSLGSKLQLESSKISGPVLKNTSQRGSNQKRNIQSYLEDYQVVRDQMPKYSEEQYNTVAMSQSSIAGAESNLFVGSRDKANTSLDNRNRSPHHHSHGDKNFITHRVNSQATTSNSQYLLRQTPRESYTANLDSLGKKLKNQTKNKKTIENQQRYHQLMSIEKRQEDKVIIELEGKAMNHKGSSSYQFEIGPTSTSDIKNKFLNQSSTSDSKASMLLGGTKDNVHHAAPRWRRYGKVPITKLAQNDQSAGTYGGFTGFIGQSLHNKSPSLSMERQLRSRQDQITGVQNESTVVKQGMKRSNLEAIKDTKNIQKIQYKHTFQVDIQKSTQGRSSSNKIRFATDMPRNLNVIKHMSPKNNNQNNRTTTSKFQDKQQKLHEKKNQKSKKKIVELNMSSQHEDDQNSSVQPSHQRFINSSKQQQITTNDDASRESQQADYPSPARSPLTQRQVNSFTNLGESTSVQYQTSSITQQTLSHNLSIQPQAQTMEVIATNQQQQSSGETQMPIPTSSTPLAIVKQETSEFYRFSSTFSLEEKEQNLDSVYQSRNQILYEDSKSQMSNKQSLSNNFEKKGSALCDSDGQVELGQYITHDNKISCLPEEVHPKNGMSQRRKLSLVGSHNNSKTDQQKRTLNPPNLRSSNPYTDLCVNNNKSMNQAQQQSQSMQAKGQNLAVPQPHNNYITKNQSQQQLAKEQESSDSIAGTNKLKSKSRSGLQVICVDSQNNALTTNNQNQARNKGTGYDGESVMKPLQKDKVVDEQGIKKVDSKDKRRIRHASSYSSVISQHQITQLQNQLIVRRRNTMAAGKTTNSPYKQSFDHKLQLTKHKSSGGISLNHKMLKSKDKGRLKGGVRNSPGGSLTQSRNSLVISSQDLAEDQIAPPQQYQLQQQKSNFYASFGKSNKNSQQPQPAAKTQQNKRQMRLRNNYRTGDIQVASEQKVLKQISSTDNIQQQQEVLDSNNKVLVQKEQEQLTTQKTNQGSTSNKNILQVSFGKDDHILSDNGSQTHQKDSQKSLSAISFNSNQVNMIQQKQQALQQDLVAKNKNSDINLSNNNTNENYHKNVTSRNRYDNQIITVDNTGDSPVFNASGGSFGANSGFEAAAISTSNIMLEKSLKKPTQIASKNAQTFTNSFTKELDIPMQNSNKQDLQFSGQHILVQQNCFSDASSPFHQTQQIFTEIDILSLAQQLKVPQPSSNQDLILLPDFKLAQIELKGQIQAAKFQLNRQQLAQTFMTEAATNHPVLEKFNF